MSSDSDFTALARRLREEGLVVYGFGEKKTPEPFVAACDKFIYTEVLRPAPGAPEGKPPEPPSSVKLKDAAEPSRTAAVKSGVQEKPSEAETDPLELLKQAVEEEADDSGWAHLGGVGSYVQRIRADFDSRLYGSKKLSDRLKKYPKHFEIEERGASGSASKTVYVRRRPKSAPSTA